MQKDIPVDPSSINEFIKGSAKKTFGKDSHLNRYAIDPAYKYLWPTPIKGIVEMGDYAYRGFKPPEKAPPGVDQSAWDRLREDLKNR
jgi:hypothetical protein